MAHPTRETEDHVAPGRRGREALCGSVLVGRTFLVELPAGGLVIIGRDADADLQLGSASVSRRHAELQMRGDHAALTDLGSRNGTFVNGERLGASSRRVTRGDELSFGTARLALFDRAMIPAGAHPVLLRSTLLERIDAAIEGGGAVHLVAIRTRPCWYEVEALHRWLRSLPPDAVAGMLSEQALVVMSGEPLAGADLGADVAVGHAELRATGARTADELVTIALSPTLAPGARPRAAAVPAGPAPASPATRAMREEAAKIAPSAVSVLLTGETGVGKEVLARFIHERSGRSGPLVSVNTAALPESLVESELFGHERGAFSGALQAKVGLVEAAHGGTLFLDEIGDLPLALQAKLLRVLEERAVRRLGATVERKVDVRVIAATHRDLERAVAEGTFRRDLLFRVNAATLVIPPLRERAVEIEPLALELLRDLAERATPPRRPWGLSAEATALLRAYPWPGNIRELRNVVERGAALAPEAAALLPEHLPEHVRSPRARPASDAPRGPADGPPPPSGDVRGALADYERRRILDALDQVQGNQSQAAKLLGLPRRTLAYKMARLGIRVSG